MKPAEPATFSGKKALEKGDIYSRALLIPSTGAMKTAVADDPYAIGYVSLGHMDAGVAPVAIDGVMRSPLSS